MDAASTARRISIHAHRPVVVLDHDLVDPATLGGRGDDLRESLVVAAQAAEADLTHLLELLEGGFDIRVLE